MPNRRVVTTGLASIGLLVTVTEAVAQDAEVTINQRTSRFVPETVSIKAGETVSWDNPGIITHSVTFDPKFAKVPGNVVLPPGVAPFDSGDMEEDATFKHTFTVAGTYKYICKYHEEMGMTGTVVVT
jgi:plastocyanin